MSKKITRKVTVELTEDAYAWLEARAMASGLTFVDPVAAELGMLVNQARVSERKIAEASS